MAKKQSTKSPSLEPKLLRTFLEVAELGSFSAAARSLRITQGSVSQQIASLERSLGVTLLDRLRRRATPTEPGRLLIRRARELLTLQETTLAELAELLGVRTGTVVLGASTTPAEHLLPPLLAPFLKANPAVEVAVRVHSSSVVADRVLDGAVAFGVVGSRRSDTPLVYTPIVTDRLVLVVSTDHAWGRRRKPIAPEKLYDVPWVVRERESGTRRTAEDCLEQQCGLDVSQLQQVAELGSPAAVREAVRLGLGVALVSERSSAADVAARRLHQVRVAGLACDRELLLVCDQRRSLSPAAKALFDALFAISD